MTPFIIDDRETPRFRVNRRVFVSQDVFDAEQERIFNASWLYVGHETEIPMNNDFRARRVGGREIILCRDKNGQVRVFFNSCTHRGALLCREDGGNGRFLKCFYHSWSFDTEGHLVAMPDDESYGPNFDRVNLGLHGPAKVESYRGFVFLSYNPKMVDLMTYLASARTKLDHIADQHEGGGMEVLRGSHKYSIRANWKLLVENSMDGYHAAATHARYFKMYTNFVERSIGSDAAATRFMPGIGRQGGFNLGNGHAFAGLDQTEPDPTGAARMLPDADTRAREASRQSHLTEIHGEDYMSRVRTAGNVVYFPNLVIVDGRIGIVVRKIDPISPDYTEITAWELAPSDEDPELRACRASDTLTFFGPGGMGTPDDVEALEVCQRGYSTHNELEWNDISRGMGRVPGMTDEFHMRSFWRRWNELITGEVPDYDEEFASAPSFPEVVSKARA